MKVRYKNEKAVLTVVLPIGVHRPSEGKGKLEFGKDNPVIEMSDADALALVKLDPRNFELVEEKKKAKSE